MTLSDSDLVRLLETARDYRDDLFSPKPLEQITASARAYHKAANINAVIALVEELQAARKALEPFAKMAQSADHLNYRDETVMFTHIIGRDDSRPYRPVDLFATLTAGDFRRAAALAPSHLGDGSK